MKGKLSITTRVKAAVLMLCVLFMMLNTCPIRSLLANVINTPIENSMQGKKTANSNSFVYDNLRCADGKVAKAVVLDFSKSGNKSLPLPLFLTIISLYLSLSILSSRFTAFNIEEKYILKNGVPLFLRNRSIII